ncbi:hypothetical protein [Novosphingobium sp.]|uniref:hypothetical protein n=1 Tax=Novosphingobium sp. TaxID=1874826 RepID=UPI0038BB1471
MPAFLISAAFLAPFIAIGLLRYLLFDGINSAFSGSRRKYRKSRLVDMGILSMIASVEIGIIAIEGLPSLSVDSAVLVVVMLCCIGAIILAAGLREEWDQNH